MIEGKVDLKRDIRHLNVFCIIKEAFAVQIKTDGGWVAYKNPKVIRTLFMQNIL